MVHLIYKSHLAAVFYVQKITLSVLLKTHYFGRKVEFNFFLKHEIPKKLPEIQEKLPEIPKKVPENQKKVP